MVVMLGFCVVSARELWPVRLEAGVEVAVAPGCDGTRALVFLGGGLGKLQGAVEVQLFLPVPHGFRVLGIRNARHWLVARGRRPEEAGITGPLLLGLGRLLLVVPLLGVELWRPLRSPGRLARPHFLASDDAVAGDLNLGGAEPDRLAEAGLAGRLERALDRLQSQSVWCHAGGVDLPGSLVTKTEPLGLMVDVHGGSIESRHLDSCHCEGERERDGEKEREREVCR